MRPASLAPARAARHATRASRHDANDWAFLAVSFWFVGGLYLDGWAHTHLPELETFFTPWHAVLYSGFFATAAVAGAWAWRRRREGAGLREILRAPYGLSLAGVALFFVGGIADGVWHELFGIEVSIEALLSPSHLLLATGLALIVTGPLRVAWRRLDDEPALRALLPGLLSAALFLSVVGFFSQVWHPLVRPWAGAGNLPAETIFRLAAPRPVVPDAPGGITAIDAAHIAGTAGFVIQGAILAATTLLLTRRFRLPFGALAVLFTLPALLIGVMRDQTWTIPVALAAGLALDAALLRLRPVPAEPWRFRALAAGVPLVYWSLYLAALAVVEGIGWSIHAAGGAVFLSCAAGLLLSYLVFPPRGGELASYA